MLKADHRQVAEWFAEFENARSKDRKLKLAKQICAALRVHTSIKEGILYPDFLQATKDEDLHPQAIVEHVGAKNLIAQIEQSAPSDEFLDSKALRDDQAS